MKSRVNVVPGQAFSIHELRAPAITVKEFISPAGEVFAVSWQGSFAPDLHALLGEYFDQYMRAVQTSARTRRHALHVETGDLVFESGGHMRFIVGRAYLRSKLPNGASADAIR